MSQLQFADVLTDSSELELSCGKVNINAVSFKDLNICVELYGGLLANLAMIEQEIDILEDVLLDRIPYIIAYHYGKDEDAKSNILAFFSFVTNITDEQLQVCSYDDIKKLWKEIYRLNKGPFVCKKQDLMIMWKLNINQTILENSASLSTEQE